MTKVYICPGELGCAKSNQFEAITIIVDALRASATLITLIEKEVEAIYVVSEVEEAWNLKKKLPNALLIGERNNFKIKGFDFSNSPTEILNVPSLKNKEVIFTSTSGARAILGCNKAYQIFIGTTLNASSVGWVAKKISLRTNKPIVIVPCGIFGKETISEEDILSAWIIAEKIGLPVINETNWLSKEVCRASSKEIFIHSKHGKELIECGLSEDVKFCSRVDIFHSVPRVVSYLGDRIALVKKF